MAAMNMVSAGGFLGVSFYLRKCPQGVASVLCKKSPIFGVTTIKVRQPDGTSVMRETVQTFTAPTRPATTARVAMMNRVLIIMNMTEK